MKLRAAASFYVALILALGGFAGSAFAGDHGQGNDGKQSTTTSTTSTGGDNSTGVKPSNTTQHDTHAAASSDKTKKYGNGKTAGQIATKAGYGDSTLHGPGNSQPHKVNCGSRHEVDVHALKNKQCGDVTAAKHDEKSKPAHTTTPAPEHKVTICHKTGSATNPYVEITVDEHALKNGHTAAKGDIIPAPAGGCPTAQESGTPTTETTTEAAETPSTTTDVTTTVETTTTTTTTTSAAAAAAATASSTPAAPAATPAGGVLGAVTALHPAKAKAKAKAPAGGVLGTTVRLGKKVGGSTLPFTGLPLWIFALVAAGLILVGATARRAGAER